MVSAVQSKNKKVDVPQALAETFKKLLDKV